MTLDIANSPDIRPCSRCRTAPRDRKNSSYCKVCRNAHAAEYRLRARPRPTTETRVCQLEGCEESFTWSSMHPKQVCCCKSHYNQWRYWKNRPADEVVPEGTKRCPRCREQLALTEFSPSMAVRAGGYCRACGRIYQQEWHAANTDRRSAATRKSRAARLLREYGAPTDDIDQLIWEQNGVCYLCGGLPGVKGFSIDHDHELEELGLPSYRGLACHNCNLSVGRLGDDPDRMRLVADNLETRKAELRATATSERSFGQAGSRATVT